jgi:hypothetical protein
MTQMKIFLNNFWPQGHTLLDRIAGADAPALTQAITKHASGTVRTYAPKSHTTAAPPAPQNGGAAETPEELDARLRRLMNQSRVVLFMKGNPEEPRCGFSRKLSTLLKEQGVQFSTFDILQDEDVRQGASRFLRLSSSHLFFFPRFLWFCIYFFLAVC